MRFGKIQYLNLMPFDVFLKSCPIPTRYKSAAFANRSYPSKLNQSFLFHRIDAGFISTIAGYTAHRKQRGTQAGIVAKGAVWSVLSLESNGDLALGSHSSDFVDFRATADSCSSLKSTKSPTSTTAIPRILEENNQAESGKFKHPLESTFSKVDSRVDCHAANAARNDRENNATNKKVDSSLNAHSPSLRDTAPAVAWQSISAQADSKQNAHKAEHPESTFLKVDSSTATSLNKPAKDSRILELESGFLLKKPASASPCTASLVFEPRKEIRLEGLSTKCGDEIHDSSPKQATRSFFRKPATAVQGVSTQAGFFSKAESPHKDYQSNTSNALSTILGLQGRVLIGDRALQYRFSGGKAIDMGQVWWEKHRLPFVFGRLCCNKHARFYANIARAFVKKRVKIPHYILQARAKACGIPSAYIREYLTHIHYHIRAKERLGLERFYRALRLQAIKPPSRIYPRNVDSSSPRHAPLAQPTHKGSSNV